MDAVGTIRPPHRTVRARLRIRLPPWMSGEEAGGRIRMQNTWSWKPLREDREVPIPRYAPLTAAAESEPPQAPRSLPADTQPVDVSRDWVVAVITYAYNHYVRLLSPEPMVLDKPQSTRV